MRLPRVIARSVIRPSLIVPHSRPFTSATALAARLPSSPSPSYRRTFTAMSFKRKQNQPEKAAAEKEKEKEPTAAVAALASVPPPPLDVRWVHTGSRWLSLPTVPISGTESFKPFSAAESARIEAAWDVLSEETHKELAEMWGREDGELAPGEKKEDKKKKKEKGESTAASTPAGRGTQSPPAPETSSPPHSAPASAAASDSESPEKVEKADLYRAIVERAQNDPERLDTVKGVPIGQDSLFEVDLRTLSLHPVFWPQTGDRIAVLRGMWFVGDETKPCSWDFAAELEKGYNEIKPWLPSYQDELAKALEIGPSAEEKLKYSLPSRFGKGLGVVFEDDSRCRIIASGALDYVSRYFYSSIGSKPSGTFIYRGFTAAATGKEVEKAKDKAAREDKLKSKAAIKEKEREAKEAKNKGKDGKTGVLSKDEEKKIVKGKEPETAKDTKPKAKNTQVGKAQDDLPDSLQDILSRVRTEFDTKRKALEEANAPIIHARNDDEPCTDLILVIHGIGQNLATQYESFSFIYASNQLRQVLRKQSLDPELASIMRNRRCQILPVQWRANLKLENESSSEEAQHERDNVYTIADITIGKAIPYVRQITNSVLLDIPLFMSGHKQKMIEAVCQQANRLYRLWTARHPDFEKYGRVHIIGHSLGSALAAEILSNQPTTVPPISGLPQQAIEQNKDRFIFNTHNLFLAGSPLGVFLQLQQAHLIARAGRERTMHSPPDEAYHLPGKFGCMAVDNLYNIFYPTDPIAYAINPAVDVAVAKERPPIPIPSVNTGSFLPSLPSLPNMPSLPVPSMPSMPNMNKYLPSYFVSAENKTTDPESPDVELCPHGNEIELMGNDLCLMGTRGERRFAALNPRGALDFSLPSSSVNDYLDMITAHGNYWNDNNFGAFILNETFATVLDDARTSKAPEKVGPKE